MNATKEEYNLHLVMLQWLISRLVVLGIKWLHGLRLQWTVKEFKHLTAGAVTQASNGLCI